MSRTRAIIAGGVITMAVGAAQAGPEKIDYPADWETKFTYVTTKDRHRGNNVIVDIYANDVALKSGLGDGPLAPGSKIVMKGTKAKVDAAGQAVLDEKGRMIKDTASGAITVMEKEPGWGTEYPANLRNGEWEYAVFGPDKARGTNPTQSCFECHAGVAGQDFLFTRADLAALKR